MMAEYCVWDDTNWNVLIHTIKQEKCILMLGPDASNASGVPCTEILAGRLADDIKDDLDKWSITVDKSNLAQVSQYYEIIRDRMALEQTVSSFFMEQKDAQSKIYQNIAALPFPFVITTNYDSMFYNALTKQNKKPRQERYHFDGENVDMVKEGDTAHPLIFHLFGTIDEPDSLVLSENDILNFHEAVLLNNPPLPENINTILNKEKRNMLFLGFGFRHWYLRLVLHVLKLHNRNRYISYALENHKLANVDEFIRTAIFFRESDYRIHVFNYDLLEFIKQLKSKYEKSKTCSPTSQALAVLEDVPTAFICHANEDKPKAQEIYNELKANNINPWLDKENLRGGDDWDLEIKKMVDKDIDYLIVLQSRALENKIEGYVNTEIYHAIERQKKFKGGIRFIIPTTIEQCELHEELEMLHTIDLSDKSKYPELIKTIRKDWERRKRSKQ